MRLERININADYVFDRFGEYCDDGMSYVAVPKNVLGLS